VKREKERVVPEKKRYRQRKKVNSSKVERRLSLDV